MRSDDSLFKHLAICAVISVVFYAVFFSWMQHRRTFKGPWLVDFRSDASGIPSIVISETNLNISETLVFPAGSSRPSNFSRAIAFKEAVQDLPFGQMLFQDPTFLPGTVTMLLFGHQVQLLPRVLTIDKKEYPWQPGAVIQVNTNSW